MIKRYSIWAFAAVILLFTACIDKDVPDPAPVITSGTANFSRYVAIGNSLAAGYTNGGLYNAGMQASYPNLLAGQFALAGGGSFTSPLFPANQANGTGYLKLSGTNSDGTPSITQVAAQAVRGQAPVTNVPLYTKYTGDLNNYGVPGIKIANVLDNNYGNLNDFYERLLAGNAGSNTTTYRDFVTFKRSTFFTLELGSNDALDYATSDGMTASRALTTQNVFEFNYLYLLPTIFTTLARSGVVATVPDVTVLPYFHYITVAALKAVAAKRGFRGSLIWVQALDAFGTYSARPATDADLIMLTVEPNQIADPRVGSGTGLYGIFPGNPLPSSAVLDAVEVRLVQDAITGYNNTIRNLASTFFLPIFDAYALFNQLKNGVTQDEVTINTNFLNGGVFSLDGIHLTPRGNAYVADEIIKVINAKYGSNLPALNISKYGGAGSN